MSTASHAVVRPEPTPSTHPISKASIHGDQKVSVDFQNGCISDHIHVKDQSVVLNMNVDPSTNTLERAGGNFDLRSMLQRSARRQKSFGTKNLRDGSEFLPQRLLVLDVQHLCHPSGSLGGEAILALSSHEEVTRK